MVLIILDVISRGYLNSSPSFSSFRKPCAYKVSVCPRYSSQLLGSDVLILISLIVGGLGSFVNLLIANPRAKEQPQLSFEQDWNSRKNMTSSNKYFTPLI